MIEMPFFAEATLACLIERYIGYPNALFRIIGHPVQWMGALIAWLDTVLNTKPEDEIEGVLRGGVVVVMLLAATALPAYMLQDLLNDIPGGWLLNVLVATAFIAQKSMRDHVQDVANAMSSSVTAGRQSVAKIVGRDTTQLDESGIAKAALESLAENTADGIVAPVLWYALFGLPGLVAYKAINTADSMIGHKSDRHLFFGFCAAKLDDLVNLPASRLTAVLFAAAATFTSAHSAKDALKSAWDDASKHQSPNAGWPEAAMAGALGLKFGGPRDYADGTLDLPWMGNGRDSMTRADITTGLALYDKALWIMFGVLALVAIGL
jgi:adenosylcobinamide-phosphate synthase